VLQVSFRLCNERSPRKEERLQLNEKHKLLISIHMINSSGEHKYSTESTGNLSVSRARIGLEVHNEEANICPHLLY
jgi:hypothetical protein